MPNLRRHINTHNNNNARWRFPFTITLLISITLTFTYLLRRPPPSPPPPPTTTTTPSDPDLFVESELSINSIPNKSTQSTQTSSPPRLAYLISGTKGDSQRMIRVLQAVYHPRNYYILHLDLEAPPRERLDLTMTVKGESTFSQVGNVKVMSQSNLVTYKGPTMFATTLQAIAILLKDAMDWDWFINLSASDYPLVTQDDLLYVFSNMSRDLNFIEHAKISGWKLTQRVRPVIVDPGLYLSKKSDLALTTQRRSLPTAFKLFTGSAWVVLTRTFLQYCLWGWDNLPRTVLMYYTNFISSPEGYFHTVICNVEEFRTTAISHDLHYIAWDNPPKQHPISLTIKDYDNMVISGAPFARKFPKNDPVLYKIDKELLHRENRFAPGAWCIGSSDNDADPCSVLGDDALLRPGPGAERLSKLVRGLLSEEMRSQQCPQKPNPAVRCKDLKAAAIAMTSPPVKLIERGHEMYRDGNHKQALEFYTEALSMAVTKSQKIALHSNRAACFLKLHNFKLAAQECTSVLELDHKHTGALMLRAQTLVTLKEYQSALFDVNRLIDLNPSSEVYQNLQARLKSQLSLPPIPESEAEVEEEDINKDETHVRNKCASDNMKEKEDTESGRGIVVQHRQDQDGKQILTERDGKKESTDLFPKGCHTAPEPKGRTKLDYSKWDKLETDSSGDEDEEDSQPQYQFHVKAVNVQHVK